MQLKYKRISTGLNKSELVPLDYDVFENKILNNMNKDFYESLYTYTDEHYQTFKKSKSLAGIKDISTNKLVFDFDDHQNTENARNDAKEIVRALLSEGLNFDDIGIYFSGNKGFHVQVNLNEYITRQEYENITTNLAGHLPTWDSRIKDQQRLIRSPLSKHPKTGLFKIPLTKQELDNDPIDIIKEKANISNGIFSEDRLEMYVKFRHKEVQLPPYILQLKTQMLKDGPEESINQSLTKDSVSGEFLFTDKLNLSSKPSWMSSSVKYALHEGFFIEGERNSAFMILAATYKASGFNKDDAYYMLKSVARKQAKRTGNKRYSKNELWNNIIQYVFSDNWQGGTYSITQTELLQVTAKRFNLDQDTGNIKRLYGIGESIDQFVEYAKQFSSNRIKIGIPELDKSVVLTTGMAVGILGAPGCHIKGTEILMYDGSIKKIEDIMVGELVMGPDSKPREVLQLRRGREQMVKFFPLRSEPFIVNMNHILNLTPSKNKDKRSIPGDLNITVENFIEGYKRRSKLTSYKLHKTGVDFPETDTILPIDPYLFGTWLGDGSSTKSEITNLDTEIINEWYTYAEKHNLFIRTLKTKKSKVDTYSLSSGRDVRFNPFLNSLKELNVLKNKHIPNIYLTTSRKNRLALLAGLIDTDGSAHDNKRGWDIIQKNKTLAENIVFLARSLGFHASINETIKGCYYKNEYKSNLYYRIYISGKENLLDVPVKLERKRPGISIMKNNPLHYGIQRFEILEEDNYYGFTLNEDHLYLTSDFMIHHNSGKTSFAVQFMKYTSMQGEGVLFQSLDMSSHMMTVKFLQRYIRLPFEVILAIVELRKHTEEEIQEKFIKKKFNWNDKDKSPHPLENMKYSDFCEWRELISISLDKMKEDYKHIYANYKSSTSTEDIEMDIKKYIEIHGKGPKLVVVDYLERVASNFTDILASTNYIIGRLTDLAREYNLVMMILLQPQKSAGNLNTPLLSMRAAKNSSRIEQDLRLMMTIWRPGAGRANREDDEFISLAVVKSNMGQLGRYDFAWDGLTGEIKSLDTAGKLRLERLNTNIEEEQEETNVRNNRWMD